MSEKECGFCLEEYQKEIDRILAEVKPSKYRPWTERDIALLLGLYNKIDIDELRKILNRSKASLQTAWQRYKYLLA